MSDGHDGGALRSPGFHRYALGAFKVVPLHDGVLSRDRPPGFVRNASDAEVGEAFAVAGMPRDKLTLTFAPLLVNTGKQTVLIDTGLGTAGPPGTGRLAANLAAAGVAPEAVDVVVISHFHSDHIMGLLRADGSPAFPNAEVLVPEGEWTFWMDEGRANAAPDALRDQFAGVRRVFGGGGVAPRHYRWGEEVLPGMTAVKASGHTPGMSALKIVSGDDAMMYVADITNNPLIFARHPEWQAMFDMDPEEATVTRRVLLDRAAADKLRLHFFHAPFPAAGFIAKNGTGYEYLPALWE